jgi:hypothetical protein
MVSSGVVTRDRDGFRGATGKIYKGTGDPMIVETVANIYNIK